MTNPNDPAFETGTRAEGNAETVIYTAIGLTKREWFAGMAMQSVIKYASIVAPQVRYKECAEMALKHADALIKELSK